MPTPPAKRAIQQRVADVILDGAARALAAKGPRANMTDVAMAAGVGRATVYRYFPSRDALLDELTSVTIRELRERLASARLDEVPPEDGITRVVRALVDAGDPFVVLLREQGSETREQFDDAVAMPIRRLFDRGRASGAFRDDIPSAWLVASLLGLVGGLSGSSAPPGREDASATCVRLLLDGLTPRWTPEDVSAPAAAPPARRRSGL